MSPVYDTISNEVINKLCNFFQAKNSQTDIFTVLLVINLF